MIMRIKRFKEGDPRVGDYVICEEMIFTGKEFNEICEFISNNIGQVIEINEIKRINKKFIFYTILYEEIPNNLKSFAHFNGKNINLRQMKREEIIKFSKDRNELEEYLTAKKYGL